MQRLLLGAIGSAVLALLPPVAAQCPSVALTTYGKTCEFFMQPAHLSGAFDPQSCTLALALSSARTCCNTFLANQALVLSARKLDPGLPVPVLVPGCLLSVFPDVILVQPASAGGTWRLRLPRVPFAVSLYAQGINHYFTTIGFTHDFQSSDALQIELK